jgi:uncharacterized protein YqfA (UPF0365 family)
VLFFSFVPLGLWISARASGVKIGIFRSSACGSQSRSEPHRQPDDQGHQSGSGRLHQQTGTHYLAGGNVDRVITP